MSQQTPENINLLNVYFVRILAAGDISHKPGGSRLLLLSTRPTVTFPAKEIPSWPVPNYTAW